MTEDCDRPDLEGREAGDLPEPPPVDPPEIPDGSPPEPDTTPSQFVPREDLQKAMCKVGTLSPQLLNGVFMNLLADHFSDASYIWHPSLRKYLWKPGPDSKIRIATNVQWQSIDRTNDPVSIVLKRGVQDYKQIGIGGRGEVTVEGQVLHHMVTGSHTFTAIGGSGAESEILGQELAEIWIAESYRMTNDFLFHEFQPGQVGELAAVDELGGAIGVQVTINYAYESTTLVRPIAPTHKVLSVHVAPEVQQ